MRDFLNRSKIGLLLVLTTFGLFLASIFSVFFESPSLYDSDLDLDFQQVSNVAMFSKIDAQDSKLEDLASTANYRSSYSISRASSRSNSYMINVSGKSLPITVVSKMEVEPGTGVKMFRKMIYGHSTPAIFGGLFNLRNGMTFTVTLNGTTTTYRVSDIITFEKSSATSLSVNGKRYSMDALTKNALGHDLMLLTCAGQSLGGGDATHRLAVFADKI